MDNKLCRNSKMDELAIEKLEQMQEFCWEAQSKNNDVMGFTPREAYDIFTYLLIVMKEKQIVIDAGKY